MSGHEQKLLVPISAWHPFCVIAASLLCHCETVAHDGRGNLHYQVIEQKPMALPQSTGFRWFLQAKGKWRFMKVPKGMLSRRSADCHNRCAHRFRNDTE